MLFRTDDRVREPPPALLSELDRGGSRDRLTMLVGEGEASRTYAVSLTDLRAADGPVRLAVLLDIEPELRAAEARALRELMQVLSHEIMNALTPVASLAGTVEELLAEGGLDALGPAREAVGVLARRAEGLARFAASYRALARLPPPSRVPTSVAGLIAEAARLFDSRWTPLGVTLTVEPPHSDIRADLDPDQIMQAVLNLLANAADAALQGSPDGPQGLALRSAGAGRRARAHGGGQRLRRGRSRSRPRVPALLHHQAGGHRRGAQPVAPSRPRPRGRVGLGRRKADGRRGVRTATVTRRLSEGEPDRSRLKLNLPPP